MEAAGVRQGCLLADSGSAMQAAPSRTNSANAQVSWRGHNCLQQCQRQILPSRHSCLQPFLPPAPHPSSSSCRTPPHRQYRAHAHAAPPPATPVHPSASGGLFAGLKAWLQASHSTELSEWLKAQGLVLPDLLSWLPKPLHDKIQHAEDELAILAQELVLALLVLVFIKRVKNMLSSLHHLWYNVVRKKETNIYMNHKRAHIEHTVFGALEGPVVAATALLWASHLYTLVGSLFNVNFSPKTVAVSRETSVIGVLTWFALRWKDNIIGELKARSSEKNSITQLGALDKLATVFIISFGILVTGEVAGYAFKSILALGGVSGIAIGLAARDVVGNMFGGAMLYLTRPFAQGDLIKAGSVMGHVVDIGFYSTKVLTPEKQPTFVPNAYFTNQVITNLSRATNRVINALFTLRHQDLHKVDHVVDRIQDYLSSHSLIDLQSSVNVALINVTRYDLEIQVNAVTKHSMGVHEFNRAKHEIFIQIASIIDQSGAKLSAYPHHLLPPIPVVQ